VLDEACAKLAHWRALRASCGDRTPLSMAVNLSARQLGHAGLVGEAADAIERNAIPPQTLVLELTESLVLGEDERRPPRSVRCNSSACAWRSTTSARATPRWPR
jgi:EAL domain-containing protein (putative c-di-GMP-specific phosphodiesterase class I)